MPRKKISRKIDLNGTLEDLGNTVSDEDLEKIDNMGDVELPENIALFDENMDLTGNIDPFANYYKKSEIDELLNNLSKMLSDIYNKNEIDNKLNEKLNKSGGQLTGNLILDQTIANSGIDLGNNGKIARVTTDGIWQTILQTGTGRVDLGHISIPVRFLGSATRPNYYDGKTATDLALITDLNDKLTKDNIIAGENIVVSASDNNVTIKAKNKFENISTKTRYDKVWVNKTWNGTVPKYFSLWTDGNNIYCESVGSNYVLDVETSTWSRKTWNGDYQPKTKGNEERSIWTDGENIYSSAILTNYTGTNLIYNKELEQWEIKTWNGLTSGNELNSEDIWTDGENIYYSQVATSSDSYVGMTGQQLVLDKSTSTWSPVSWSGLTEFNGEDIWTDGENIYYSPSKASNEPGIQNDYVLEKSTKTWIAHTWKHPGTYFGVTGRYIWTDGENIYYSSANTHYILNKEENSWEIMTAWHNVIYFFGNFVYKIGNKYYSGYDNKYELLNFKIRT